MRKVILITIRNYASEILTYQVRMLLNCLTDRAEDDTYVSYLEGCTAPMRDENQLHAAVVEIVVLDNAEVKYSTVQNWYPGDENGRVFYFCIVQDNDFNYCCMQLILVTHRSSR